MFLYSLCFHLHKSNRKNSNYFGIINHKNNIKFKFHSYHAILIKTELSNRLKQNEKSIKII